MNASHGHSLVRFGLVVCATFVPTAFVGCLSDVGSAVTVSGSDASAETGVDAPTPEDARAGELDGPGEADAEAGVAFTGSFQWARRFGQTG